MRVVFFYIIFFYFANSCFSQNDTNKFTRERLAKIITNTTVIEAKLLYHQGETEKSIKTGLDILLSKEALTPVDSFYTYQTLAYNFYKFKDYEQALDYAQHAIEIGNRTNFENKPNDAWIGAIYLDLAQYDLAISSMKKELKSVMNMKDTISIFRIYNNIGWAYYNNNQNDSAKVYYNKIIEFENAKNYPIAYGLAKGNYGLILLKNKDYTNAISHFEVDAQMNKGKLWSSYFGAMNRIAECYFYLGEYKKVEQVLLSLSETDKMNDEQKLKKDTILANAYQKMNQPAMSDKYLREYITLKQAIEKERKPTEAILNELSKAKVNAIQTNLILTKKELDLLDEKLISKTLRSQFYIVSLFSLLIISGMYFMFYKNKQKKNRTIYKLKNNLLEADLQNKKNDLNSFGLNLSYKRKFISKVQTKLKNIKNEPPEILKEKLTALIIEFNNYKSMDKNIELLQVDMEKVNTSFFNKLNKQFPSLTKNERELCGLLLLNISSKDIANYRNISLHAVKKARQRIREKLPITEKENLSEFLESINKQ